MCELCQSWLSLSSEDDRAEVTSYEGPNKMPSLLTRNEPSHMSRGRGSLGDTGDFGYCVCQLPVTVAKTINCQGEEVYFGSQAQRFHPIFSFLCYLGLLVR